MVGAIPRYRPFLGLAPLMHRYEKGVLPMLFSNRFSRIVLGAALIASLAACSQARRGIGSRGAQDELWNTLEFCQVPQGAQLLGCFDMQLDVTGNLAYLDVKQLGFNPAQVPYRILARKRNDSAFTVLKDSVTTAVGSSIEVPAKGNTLIYDYEEWRVELTAWSNNQIDWFPTGAGQGKLVTQVIMNWPELQNLPDYKALRR